MLEFNLKLVTCNCHSGLDARNRAKLADFIYCPISCRLTTELGAFTPTEPARGDAADCRPRGVRKQVPDSRHVELESSLKRRPEMLEEAEELTSDFFGVRDWQFGRRNAVERLLLHPVLF